MWQILQDATSYYIYVVLYCIYRHVTAKRKTCCFIHGNEASKEKQSGKRASQDILVLEYMWFSLDHLRNFMTALSLFTNFYFVCYHKLVINLN